jgi:hypothetical protein
MVSKPKGQRYNALWSFDTILPPASNMCVPGEKPPGESSPFTQIDFPAFALLRHEQALGQTLRAVADLTLGVCNCREGRG